MSPINEKALTEKNKGNDAYRNKDFALAHSHYDKAIYLDHTNMILYSNKAAVLFEEGKFNECIELCQKAVEIGRNNQADFKNIAKALTRIGNSYQKLDNFDEALVWFDKSISEYRDSEILKKRQKLDKDIKEQKRLLYINPEIAQQEKNLGNELFKKGDFPGAIRHYQEAVKRDPNNAVLYSNRAACYSKLMEFNLALVDCQTCIELDPKFIKGYIRKGAVLTALKQNDKAQKAYEAALNIDENNQEARTGLMNCIRSNDSDPEQIREKALQDPEVQAILKDPAMRLVLEQMSTDPGAIKEHLKNPEILQKLLKLKEAGIVQMRSA